MYLASAAAVGHQLGRHADQLGRDHHLLDVAVGLFSRQRRAEHLSGRDVGVDKRRVHPQQQRWITRGIGLTGLVIDAGDLLMDPPDAGGGALSSSPFPECNGCQVGRRGGEPADRVGAPVAVLVNACHRKRVQRLDHERSQPSDGRRQVTADAPGDARGAEEPVIGWLVGNAAD